MAIIYPRYKKITSLPAGHFLFSKAIGFIAPFFGKIKPKVIELKPAYCEVEIKDRWGVRNHIGTVNAGALCTLAELVGGMALDTVVPNNMRWIPRGMTVAYIKKASGTLNAVSTFDPNAFSEGDFVVPIVVKNRLGETVFTADINFYISQNKAKR